mgnify:CR=1 FL=1
MGRLVQQTVKRFSFFAGHSSSLADCFWPRTPLVSTALPFHADQRPRRWSVGPPNRRPERSHGSTSLEIPPLRLLWPGAIRTRHNTPRRPTTRCIALGGGAKDGMGLPVIFVMAARPPSRSSFGAARGAIAAPAPSVARNTDRQVAPAPHAQRTKGPGSRRALPIEQRFDAFELLLRGRTQEINPVQSG